MQKVNNKKYKILINRHKTKLFLTIKQVDNLIEKHDLKLVVVYDFPSGFRFKEITIDRLKYLINNDMYNDLEINLNKYTEDGNFNNSIIQQL